MHTVKILSVSHEQKTSRAGKPYSSCIIKALVNGAEKRLTGFTNAATEKYQAGEDREVDIEEVAGRNGTIYYNFKPSESDLNASKKTRGSEFEQRLKAVEDDLKFVKEIALARYEAGGPLRIAPGGTGLQPSISTWATTQAEVGGMPVEPEENIPF